MLDSIVWSNAKFYIYSFGKSQDCDMRTNCSPQQRHCPTLCHGHDACRPHAAADNLLQKRG